MLTDFTIENGCTRVVPMSHRSRRKSPPEGLGGGDDPAGGGLRRQRDHVALGVSLLAALLAQRGCTTRRPSRRSRNTARRRLFRKRRRPTLTMPLLDVADQAEPRRGDEGAVRGAERDAPLAAC